jgi:ferredoxin
MKDASRPAYSLLNSTRHRSSQLRTFSICQRHESEIRAKKSAIQAHIQALEQSRRRFSTSPRCLHGHIDPPKPGEELHVTIIDKDGDEHKFEVAEGDNLLDIAQANDLEMEGACGGSCACSTCHVVVQEEDYFDKIPEADDDENGTVNAVLSLLYINGLQICWISLLGSRKLRGWAARSR